MMSTFKEIVEATGKDFHVEKTIRGYYRLMEGDKVYHDDSCNEDVNGTKEHAEQYYAELLLEYEVPETKKQMRGGIWFLKKGSGMVNMSWHDEESLETFTERVADRLYSWIGTDYECRVVECIGGSSISRYYRTGESVKSETAYVYEVDKDGKRTRID